MDFFVIFIEKFIMSEQQYENLKIKYYNLTKKNADEDLSAFFSFVNTLLLLDIKDHIDVYGKKG